MVSWTKKKWYINDTFEISLGKLIFMILITLFQFIGAWCDNKWVLSGSMFLLVANALLTISKSTKEIEKEIEALAKKNADKIQSLENVIKVCEGELERQSITDQELLQIVKGIENKLNEGMTPSEIVETIKNLKDQ